MLVQECTQRFLCLRIRTDMHEEEEQASLKYLNGLKFQVQDERMFVQVNTIDEAYQYALEPEEKLSRKQGGRIGKFGRGRNK